MRVGLPIAGLAVAIGGLSGGFIVAGSERVYRFLSQLPERIMLFKHHPIGRADYQELVTVNGLRAVHNNASH
ncbi:MAG: hypothetical protein ACXVAM_04805 [Vulcanimicrobiaceae bacterium]